MSRLPTLQRKPYSHRIMFWQDANRGLSSRVSAETARSLGWKPKWPKGSIWEFIEPEWKAVLDEKGHEAQAEVRQ